MVVVCVWEGRAATPGHEQGTLRDQGNKSTEMSARYKRAKKGGKQERYWYDNDGKSRLCVALFSLAFATHAWRTPSNESARRHWAETCDASPLTR